jgi:hypothetical protein
MEGWLAELGFVKAPGGLPCSLSWREPEVKAGLGLGVEAGLGPEFELSL